MACLFWNITYYFFDQYELVMLAFEKRDAFVTFI